MRTLAILGSTGSVGTQTIAVLRRNPGQYNVQLLAANSNWRLMEEQIRQCLPKHAVLVDPDAALELKLRVRDLPVQVHSGPHALLEQVATGYSMVVASMVGQAGLLPVITAIEAGSDIAIANKEVLVMAGHLVTAGCKEKGVRLLPLDSEHSAIFQCLEGHSLDVQRLILTASGGPFRGMSQEELKGVGPAQALKHPNWQMGAKISVDSATLMNKGLEIIEAHWLFGIEPDKISVLVHPQSIVHSMVEFVDGSVLGQLGVPSMELPIQYALSWPRRWQGVSKHFIDWLKLPPLTFQEPDIGNFPCLQLARNVLTRGGNAPATLSTANDLCVEAFLAGKLKFTAIPQVIEKVLDRVPWQAEPNLDEIIETMERVKAETRAILNYME